MSGNELEQKASGQKALGENAPGRDAAGESSLRQSALRQSSPERHASGQDASGESKARRKQRRPPDARVRRSCERLGSALIELIKDRPIDEITVQDVLDRASVGRSTFYVHYRDKDDLLFSQLEWFLEIMSTALSVRKEASLRVAPVAEMFDHIGGQNRMYRALSDAGHLHDFYDLAQGYFARGIEQRLVESGRPPELSRGEMAARATALAGSLLALLRWWIDRGAKESPQAMDEMFHRLVWKGLQ